MKQLYTHFFSLNPPYIRWLKNALLLCCLLSLPSLSYGQCTAGFTYTIIDDVVIYESTSTNTNGNPLRFYWNINKYYSGFFQGSDSISFQYAEPDTFTATLIVYDSIANCRDTFSDIISLNFPVICNADFDASVTPNYPTVTLDFKSKKYNPNFVYYINFGNGDEDTVSVDQLYYGYSFRYSYLYYTGGDTYNVCVRVVNTKTGCSDTVCKNVIIPHVNRTPCTANFNYYEYGQGVQFNSYSNCNVKYEWNFGDGSTSSYANPYHAFPLPGTYKVTLKVYGTALYEPDTISHFVTVKTGYCSAAFGIYGDYGYGNQLLVHFPQTPSTKFRLDFGDGTVYTQRDTSRHDSNFVHLYAKSGTYNICLIKTDTIYNCTDTVCKSVTVNDPVFCYAGFYASIDQPGRYANFQSDSNFIGMQSSRFTWDFGDGSQVESGIGQYHAYHIYSKNGTYQVKLIVSNTKENCSDTMIKSIIIKKPVYKAPIVAYTTDIVDSFIIYLVKYNETDSTLEAIDTGYVGTEADTGILSRNCIFDSLPPGKYRIKAAPAKTSDWYKDYLPTYADTTLFWEKARVIVLDGETSQHQYARVELKPGNNPGGPGFIGGKVSAGANKREGEALKDIQIMLLDVNKNPVTHTYSDADGNFKFQNIALGTYTVYTEVVGVKTNAVNATLTSDNPRVENVEVKVSKKVIITGIKAKSGEIFIQKPKLYPNPASANIYLETSLKKAERLQLNIITAEGKEIITEMIDLPAGNFTYQVNTAELPAGAYILMLKNTSGESQMQAKFMKY